MRQVLLAAALLLVMVAPGPLAAEEPATVPAVTHEAPMACPSAAEAALANPFAPIAAAVCPYGKCQVNSDCFSYCCNTYGACGGDSLCRRLSGATCGMCLC